MKWALFLVHGESARNGGKVVHDNGGVNSLHVRVVPYKNILKLLEQKGVFPTSLGEHSAPTLMTLPRVRTMSWVTPMHMVFPSSK